MLTFFLLVVVLLKCFLCYKIHIPRSSAFKIYSEKWKKFEDDSKIDVNRTVQAMKDARNSLQSNLSPGAGLQTADEQADAAYADLINTSMDQRFLINMHCFPHSFSNCSLHKYRGISELSNDELNALTKGGYMWEKNAVSQTRTFGIFGDLINVLKAVAGKLFFFFKKKNILDVSLI